MPYCSPDGGWYLLRPQGHLRPAMTKEILGDQKQSAAALELYNLVSAEVQKVSAWHAELSFQSTQRKLDLVPKKPNPGSTVLRDLITKFIVGGKTGGESGLILEIDGIVFLELLWSITNKRDYFVQFDKINDIECSNDERKNTNNIQEKCYEIAISIDNADKGGRILKGTMAQIRKDLAVYLFKSFPFVRSFDQPG